jgi:S-adenosylmethionine:tRNA ribosyltransferase-isomerase
MKLSEFDYDLPKELIAQYPLEDRNQARLLILEKKTGKIEHTQFSDICRFFRSGDILVINNTKVFKARLKGKKETGGSVEILLIKEIRESMWEAMISHAKRTKVDTKILIDKNIHATVKEKRGTRCYLDFNISIEDIIEKYGIVPLPHYIKRDAARKDEEYYQAVFAKRRGSIAAPTAGLHFTQEILDSIKKQGAHVVEITLHIGPGTFKPIRTENIEEHIMEAEYYEIPEEAAKTIYQGQRVFGVGTSVCRTLETHTQTGETSGFADLFIYPGFHFKVISCLITNFHLPCSTPLVLVSAFAGKDKVIKAYHEAIRRKYRFLSYGDAMLIL